MGSGLFLGAHFAPKTVFAWLGQRRALGSTCHGQPIPGAAFEVVSLGRAGADEDTGLAGLVQEGDELRGYSAGDMAVGAHQACPKFPVSCIVIHASRRMSTRFRKRLHKF